MWGTPVFLSVVQQGSAGVLNAPSNEITFSGHVRPLLISFRVR